MLYTYTKSGKRKPFNPRAYAMRKDAVALEGAWSRTLDCKKPQRKPVRSK